MAEEKNYMMPLIAIVAIVAIASVVVLFLSVSTRTNKTAIPTDGSDQISLVGEAQVQTSATYCRSDKDCAKPICPKVIGGNKPKCDLKARTCYCGGICGDKYCDSFEKKYNSCPADCKPTSTYFQFRYGGDTFIFELTDQAKIQQARDILAGNQTETKHIMGKIIKSPASYNAPWSFQLDSRTVQFFELAPEVCDAGIGDVEGNLAEVCGSFLPGCTWCPWGSMLIAEVTPPASIAPIGIY